MCQPKIYVCSISLVWGWKVHCWGHALLDQSSVCVNYKICQTYTFIFVTLTVTLCKINMIQRYLWSLDAHGNSLKILKYKCHILPLFRWQTENNFKSKFRSWGKVIWGFFVCILQDLDQGRGVISYIISVIAKIKPHAHHETHLRTRKIIRILVTSFQGLC